MSEHPQGYLLVHSQEGSDGFGVKLFVLRPPSVALVIKQLDNTSKKGELTPRERAACMFSRIGTEVLRMLQVQAEQLDPKTPERKKETRDKFQRAFTEAGFDVIFMEEIPNEYWGKDSPEAISDP
jgi:hypothetical protein